MSVETLLRESPFFTVADPQETNPRVTLHHMAHDWTVGVTVKARPIKPGEKTEVGFQIDKHQLAELAMMLLAFGDLDDADSIVELLDGYGFTTEMLNKVAATCERVAKALKE